MPKTVRKIILILGLLGGDGHTAQMVAAQNAQILLIP